MDRMTEYIVRATGELGLAIVAPFRCQLRDGSELVAVALLPELGGPNGTLVLRSGQVDRRVLEELGGRGFACSSFCDPPDSEEYEVDTYREMFMDWSWVSKDKEPPPWMMLERAKE
jgi:hypothetical protein